MVKKAILQYIQSELGNIPSFDFTVKERKKSGDFIYLDHNIRNGQHMKGHWHSDHFNLWHCHHRVKGGELIKHETDTVARIYDMADAIDFVHWFKAGMRLSLKSKKDGVL